GRGAIGYVSCLRGVGGLQAARQSVPGMTSRTTRHLLRLAALLGVLALPAAAHATTTAPASALPGCFWSTPINVNNANYAFPNGTRPTAQAACDAVSVDPTIPPASSSVSLLGLLTYEYFVHLPAKPDQGIAGSTPQAPATNPGTWYRPLNPCHYTDPFLQSAG